MIPFIDLSREYQRIEEDIDDAVQRVLESGYFVLGEEVESFESEFAAALESEHTVGVNSGTDALTLALDAVGVEPGDEVVTVSHSFVSTANAIVENGATPVFVDIDPETYCMDPDLLAEAVSDETAAIVPVHLYGHPAEMNRILEIARIHDVSVVEDACQAHAARYEGEMVGTIGDVGCFSFYPVKNLGAYGDGGALVTDDPDIATTARTARNVGQSEKYYHEMVGENSRLDELQAAILREKLPHLETWNDRRCEIAEMYRGGLGDTDLVLPQSVGDIVHAYHLFVVRHERRDILQDHLEDAGVGTLIHYPIPIHQQPPYRNFDHSPLPITERVTGEILSLPLSPWITDEEVETVIEKIRAFVA